MIRNGKGSFNFKREININLYVVETITIYSEGRVKMNFLELDIKPEYRSLQNDIVSEFYCPLLKIANKYQRAVGFFSSSALIEISKGITGLIKNGGIIELIASPKLSKEDVMAIEQGIRIRDEVIAERISEAIDKPKNNDEADRINLLINLIAQKKLEIKIAILEDDDYIGMFHEKLGLIYDIDQNIIAFTGSMNESNMAFRHNYESIDVFKSWEKGTEAERVINKKNVFNAMWRNYEPHITILDFPEASQKKLFQYRKNDQIDLEIDEKLLSQERNNRNLDDKKYKPIIPKWLNLRLYQNEAIDKWEEKKYVGIFDMATGTGKTYTGLAAIERLFINRKAPLGIFIVCPYQHLVAQWVEDIKKFGMNPVICHSASPQKKWTSRLKDACLSIEIGMSEHMCAIFTNATYSTKKVQDIIEKVKGQSLLIIDEAHNFGAENLSKFLDLKIPYRLALSATLDRHGDEIGTKKLYDYFEEKCIEYTLKEAIDNDMLVWYYYHPIVVNFDEVELQNYLEISKQISQAMRVTSKDEKSDFVKMLLIKRARMVASAGQKITALISEMSTHVNENHMLVYCGATTMKDIDYDEDNPPIDEKKQVNIVTKRLGNDLGMKVAKFTSEETADQREKLKSEFDKGDRLQTLIAIRCLDEGVNIPSIRKAFILASSTNPKEYIQRRGRVLRTHAGKTHADIYDFVVSPLPLDMIDDYDEETIRLSRSLVKKEIKRMKDFAELAKNPSVADSYIYSFIDKYNIEIEEEYEDE